MKNTKVSLLVLLLVVAMNACARDSLQWDYDGSVSNGPSKVQTNLQNAYTAFQDINGIYLGGFTIDAEGINYPHITFVANDLSVRKSWPMDDSVSQFFHFKDQRAAGKMLLAIDPANGAVLHQKVLAEGIQDVCSVAFP